MTCWRRLRDWQAAGVWSQLHRVLLDRLAHEGRLDWSRASVDARSLAARRRVGEEAGPNPTDRGRPGTKHHILVDAGGIPLAAGLSGANRNDCKGLVPLLDAVPTVHTGRRARPQRCPVKLQADKGYGYGFCRAACRARGIQPRIARRGIEPHGRLGRHRWVVERTLAWLARFRRLTISYERRADIHIAFLSIGCALICWQPLHSL